MKISNKKFSSFFTGKSLVKFFQKITFETIFQKVTVVVWFWKKFRRPPTCLKFNTHKKFVAHFFIPMLLLPLTPPLIYLKIKKFKGTKVDHFFSLHFSLPLFHFHFRYQSRGSLDFAAGLIAPRGPVAHRKPIQVLTRTKSPCSDDLLSIGYLMPGFHLIWSNFSTRLVHPLWNIKLLIANMSFHSLKLVQHSWNYA